MQTVGKSLFFVLLLYWSYILLFAAQPWIFLDGVNLIFHEAGHWIFFVSGQFMSVLGGSLLQCLIPLGIGFYFFVTHQYFSSAFCLFWLGDNFIDVSVYISDARTKILPLLGGDGAGHDWHWLLDTMHLLAYDTAIGGVLWWGGALCVVLSLSYILFVKIKEYSSTVSGSSFF